LVAGGISVAFIRKPNGQVIRFYCTISSSGRITPVTVKPAWWLPSAQLK
jgi:hypothetical protein